MSYPIYTLSYIYVIQYNIFVLSHIIYLILYISYLLSYIMMFSSILASTLLRTHVI